MGFDRQHRISLHKDGIRGRLIKGLATQLTSQDSRDSLHIRRVLGTAGNSTPANDIDNTAADTEVGCFAATRGVNGIKGFCCDLPRGFPAIKLEVEGDMVS